MERGHKDIFAILATVYDILDILLNSIRLFLVFYITSAKLFPLYVYFLSGCYYYFMSYLMSVGIEQRQSTCARSTIIITI